MPQVLEALIETNGEIRLLEPIKLSHKQRALVTILDESQPRVRSKYAGAFASGQTDTSARVDEVLEELGFAQ